ncbi:hypothetical protein L218DRAFT_1073831 [Marasmius fiardii PR-910]|nr:hypothetical protein L218DRAFT_1073831 [Marasmius fiardii PR-910]
MSSSMTNRDEEQANPTTRLSKISSYLQYLQEDVDPQQCTGPLAAFCFMTGFIDSISFSAVFVWCGFQTGNFIQLAVALARLFEGSPSQQDHTFHKADQQALASLLAFNVGAFLGRWGDHHGSHKRSWQIIGTFVQTLFTMAAALTIWKSGSRSIADNRGDPAWSNGLSFATLIFMSASLGLQGIQGKRLNTQFTTTSKFLSRSLVLTTVWVELMSDPKLFNLRQKVITRDHKLIAAGSLFLGGFVSRAILGKIGDAGALGVAVGIRLLITLAWFFVPAKQKKVSEERK